MAEWLGHEVDVDFRFFEPSDIAKAIERAGFRVEMRLERLSYPREVESAASATGARYRSGMSCGLVAVDTSCSGRMQPASVLP